jgi:hypothetical protein
VVGFGSVVVGEKYFWFGVGGGGNEGEEEGEGELRGGFYDGVHDTSPSRGKLRKVFEGETLGLDFELKLSG